MATPIATTRRRRIRRRPAPWSILRMTVAARLGAALAVSAGLWVVVLAGDEVSMAAQAQQFRDVTLGYDRHPAVHHLNGEVAAGRAARRGRAERRRQVDAVSRHRRHAEAAGGLDLARRSRQAATSPTCRRPPTSTAAFRSRCSISSAWACGARPACSAAWASASASGSSRRLPPSASTVLRTAPIGTLSGGQMQRMLFARVLLQDARLIVLDEPFNAIDAKTSADLLALVQALARREAARCWRRCTISTSCAPVSPKRCCWRAGRWPGARPPRC